MRQMRRRSSSSRWLITMTGAKRTPCLGRCAALHTAPCPKHGSLAYLVWLA